MQVDFDSRAGSLAFAVCLAAWQSLPPSKRNGAAPPSKCHQHATGVTIYVKLKWNLPGGTCYGPSDELRL